MQEKIKAGKPSNARKQPYRVPRVVSYGSISRLTRAKGGDKSDGASPKSKAAGGGQL